MIFSFNYVFTERATMYSNQKEALRTKLDPGFLFLKS